MLDLRHMKLVRQNAVVFSLKQVDNAPDKQDVHAQSEKPQQVLSIAAPGYSKLCPQPKLVFAKNSVDRFKFRARNALQRKKTNTGRQNLGEKRKSHVLENAASLPLISLCKYVFPGKYAFPQSNGGDLQAVMRDERIRNLSQACEAAATVKRRLLHRLLPKPWRRCGGEKTLRILANG